MESKRLSRRGFLGLLAMSSASLLAACAQPAEPSQPAAPTAASGGEAPTPTAVPATAVPEAPQVQKLTVICVNDQRPHFEKTLDAIKANTGATTVELIDTAWNDIHEKIVTMATGGTPVDVTYVDTIWPGEFAQAGFLVALDEFVTDEVKADLYESSWKQSVYQGSVYAMPYSQNAKWMFYNKEMLEAAGIAKPAETWDEFVEHSQLCVDKGLAKYGVSWGWMLAEGLTCDWTVFLHAFGGKWRDGEDELTGDWVFNSAEGAAALQFMKDSIAEGGFADPGSLQLDDRTDLNTFMAGETPYNMNWSYAWWFANDPNESQVANKMGITIWPAEPPVRSSSVTGGGGFGIMKSTSDVATAWKVIETMTSKDAMLVGLREYSNAPIWKSFGNDPAVLEEFPFWADMCKQYEYAHFRPVIPWYTEWSQNMQTEIQNCLTGAKSAQQALDDALKFSSEGSQKYNA